MVWFQIQLGEINPKISWTLFWPLGRGQEITLPFQSSFVISIKNYIKDLPHNFSVNSSTDSLH